jgi:hypothetical protein
VKWFTAALVAVAAAVLGVLLMNSWFCWSDLLHNLLAGLVVAIVTVSLVNWIVKRETASGERQRAEPVLLGPMMEVYASVLDEARWLLDPGPPGVEASAPWARIADSFKLRREKLGQILTADMLLQVVQLEADLRKIDFLTARSDETRKNYREAVLKVWVMLLYMFGTVVWNKQTRKKYMKEPPDIAALRKQAGAETPRR